VKQTSIDAYKEIMENGLLSKRREEVYDVIFKHGPITIYECLDTHLRHLEANSVSPRFGELEKLGVIAITGQKLNPHSGHLANLYEATNYLPIKLDKKISNFQMVKRYKRAAALLAKYAPENIKEEARKIIRGDNEESSRA
jgi:hypothetical protein